MIEQLVICTCPFCRGSYMILDRDNQSVHCATHNHRLYPVNPCSAKSVWAAWLQYQEQREIADKKTSDPRNTGVKQGKKAGTPQRVSYCKVVRQDYLHLGIMLRMARVRSGMSQRVLAQQLGVRDSTISTIEVGKATPHQGLCDLLNEILGIRLVSLVPAKVVQGTYHGHLTKELEGLYEKY